MTSLFGVFSWLLFDNWLGHFSHGFNEVVSIIIVVKSGELHKVWGHASVELAEVE